MWISGGGNEGKKDKFGVLEERNGPKKVQFGGFGGEFKGKKPNFGGFGERKCPILGF